MQVHIDRGGQRFGPYGLDEINAHLVGGMLQPTDLAWADGMPGWVPVTQIPGVNAPGAAAPPPPSSPGAPPPVPPAPSSAPVTAAAGNSASKKKLLIGVGATVAVCAIGAALWFFVFKKEDAEPVKSVQQPKTLAEFIKDKRIYLTVPLSPEAPAGFKMPEMFVQFISDGTMEVGMANNGIEFAKPDDGGKYVVDGLTVNVTRENGEKNQL